MKYNYSSKVTTHNVRDRLVSGMVSAVVAAGSVGLAVPVLGHAQGGTPSVDVSQCNTLDTIVNYDVAFPDGTIKARANPNFVVSGASLCQAQFTARLVSVTTAYTYDVVSRSNLLATTPGYPVREVSKDITVKPGAFSVSNKLGDKFADQVLQMRTETRMYMSTSFDASGKLLPGAVVLGTDTASWTQTNFVTQ